MLTPGMQGRAQSRARSADPLQPWECTANLPPQPQVCGTALLRGALHI